MLCSQCNDKVAYKSYNNTSNHYKALISKSSKNCKTFDCRDSSFFCLFQLSQALTVLTDPEARKAYDNVLKAKQATQIRHQQLDAKRQKLKEKVQI